jgi:tRNA (cytosine38-C5)-methyltransferase
VTLECVSVSLLFSGGLHLALKRSLVPGTVVRAFDWDQAACQVYTANYGPKVASKVRVKLNWGI